GVERRGRRQDGTDGTLQREDDRVRRRRRREHRTRRSATVDVCGRSGNARPEARTRQRSVDGAHHRSHRTADRELSMRGGVLAFVTRAGTPASPQPPAVLQPPIAGVWKFNPEKSTARIPPGATEIRQYIMRPDGFLVGLLITGMPQGPFHTLQFTAKSDG